MIPRAAELVVGDDHQRVLPAVALFDRFEQLHKVAAAGALTRVAGMLVLRADRLHETDRLEVAGTGSRSGQAGGILPRREDARPAPPCRAHSSRSS